MRIDNLPENQVLVYYNAKKKKTNDTVFELYFRTIVVMWLDQNCQMALDIKPVHSVSICITMLESYIKNGHNNVPMP